MPRILIIGASGQLGSYLLRELHERDATVIAWSGKQTGVRFGTTLRPVELRDGIARSVAFDEARPDVIVHAAALASVATCARNPRAARAINVGSAASLARRAAHAGVRFVYVSTDLVFDGEHAPYREDDGRTPLSIYGTCKAAGEDAVQRLGGVVVRISLLYGPSLTPAPTLFDEQRQAILKDRVLTLFDDEWRTPLDLPTAARALIGIALSDCTGVLHVGGPQRLSRLEMGQRLAKALGRDARIDAVSRNHGLGEPRPPDVSLDASRWRARFSEEAWPSYEDAVRMMLGA